MQAKGHIQPMGQTLETIDLSFSHKFIAGTSELAPHFPGTAIMAHAQTCLLAEPVSTSKDWDFPDSCLWECKGNPAHVQMVGGNQCMRN